MSCRPEPDPIRQGCDVPPLFFQRQGQGVVGHLSPAVESRQGERGCGLSGPARADEGDRETRRPVGGSTGVEHDVFPKSGDHWTPLDVDDTLKLGVVAASFGEDSYLGRTS